MWRKGFIVGIVIVEVFTWSFLETPLTIAKYAPGEYSSNQEVRDDIDQQFSNYNQRKLGVNFTGAARSTSRYNNRVILYNKTFFFASPLHKIYSNFRILLVTVQT